MWLPFCIFSVQFIELVLRNAALWGLGEYECVLPGNYGFLSP